MTPIGHSFLLSCLSFRRMMSPSLKFGLLCYHFWWFWSMLRYSICHLVQNVSARAWTLFHWCWYMYALVKSPGGVGIEPYFCVSRVKGVRNKGASGSEETCTKGLALTIAETSAIRVVRTSWVSVGFPPCRSIESRMRCEMPIIRSQVLPMWDEWGTLNAQEHLCLPVVIHTRLTRFWRIKLQFFERTNEITSAIWSQLLSRDSDCKKICKER